MSHHSDTLLWFRVDQSINVTSLRHIIMIPCRPVYKASLRHIIMIPCRPVYKCRITQTHYYDSVSISLWMSHHSDTLLWFRVDQSINVASQTHYYDSVSTSLLMCITQKHYYDSVSTSLWMSHHSDTLLWFRVDQSMNVTSLRHIIMIPCINVTSLRHIIMIPCRPVKCHITSVSTDQSMNVTSLRHIIMIPCRPVYKCHITQTHYYDSVPTSL